MERSFIPLPTEKQLAFLDWEVGVFFHFGIRTFYEGHTDCDGKEMPAAGFSPTALDCRQWIAAAKAGGAKYTVLTAKHHDGFALWPSKYTDYGVKRSPWKNGQGDVIKEYTDACRALDMKTGLYYSPAQAGFERTPKTDYDDFFINQITELLTNYGKIDYLWFDGCGSEGHSYDTLRIVSAIRSLQPDILLFNLWDPDTRWVGNEDGMAPFDASCVVRADATDLNGGVRFLPYECDCKLHPGSWFYADAEKENVRTADEVVGLYELSVGRGGNLLINIAPDRTGKIPASDAAIFAAAGEKIATAFARPLTIRTEATASGVNVYSDFEQSCSCAVLSEDLRRGERIRSYAVFYRCGETEILLTAGKTVGHKRIVRFPCVALGGENRLFVTFSANQPAALRISLFG